MFSAFAAFAIVTAVFAVLAIWGRGRAGSAPIPKGATLVASRSLNHWSLRIYVSPYRAPRPKQVQVSYETINPDHLIGGGSLPIGGPGLASWPGIVADGGTTGGSDQEFPLQITNSHIAVARLLAGDRVLDSMAAVSYAGVRFVVLASFGGPTPTAIEGLDSQGRILVEASLPNDNIAPSAGP